MQKLFIALGWIIIVGSVAGGIATYFFVGSQDFFLSLLARLVERPFEYRGYLAFGAALSVIVGGVLAGLVYLGMGQILKRQSDGSSG